MIDLQVNSSDSARAHEPRGWWEHSATLSAAIAVQGYEAETNLMWDVAEPDHRELHDFLIKQKRIKNKEHILSLWKAEQTQPSPTVTKNIFKEILPSHRNTRKHCFSFSFQLSFLCSYFAEDSYAPAQRQHWLPVEEAHLPLAPARHPQGWQGGQSALYLCKVLSLNHSMCFIRRAQHIINYKWKVRLSKASSQD